MKNKILIFSILINIIFILFVGIYLLNNKQNEVNKKWNLNVEMNKNINITDSKIKKINEEKRREAEISLKNKLSLEKNNIKVNKDKQCNDIILWKDYESVLWKQYYKLVNIDKNDKAKYDYEIFSNIFINRNCSFFKNKDKYDYNLCKKIGDNNIKYIENMDMPESDKLFSLSYLSNTNKCWKDVNCNFDFSFSKSLNSKIINFPSSITKSRDVEFYSYKINHKYDYKRKLDKLFLSECVKLWKLKK